MGNTLALVGNPNSGKTTLFNILTGSNQHIGNWPGVTIEKKEGKIKNTDLKIVDLPGIYSLSPYSSEEIITRNYILQEQTDIIINIVDVNNIQRNLYLSLQLIETQIPVICVINMTDELKSKNIKVDYEKLSKLLNVPVIPISAKKSENIDTLIKFINSCKENKLKSNPYISYDNKTVNTITEILQIISHNSKIPTLFAATKIIENDQQIIDDLKLTYEQKLKIRKILDAYIIDTPNIDHETLFADQRYKFIQLIVEKSFSQNYFHNYTSSKKKSISDKIDTIVTHKYLGIPIFLSIMFIMFSITFGSFGNYLKDSLEFLFSDIIGESLKGFLISINSPVWTISLIADGIISGVGGIITFIPQIALLFLFLSILEDSGYISRAAFIMDRALKKIGLSGKSFIPMLMGFGCTTTAVMSARTIENEDDRKLTIMLTPFMSCSARFVIYILFAETFFPQNKNLVVFSMYILGIVVAVISGAMLKKFVFNKSQSNFILELPPYRIPYLKTVLNNMWEKSKGFIIRAGTVILSMNIIIWFLQNFNFSLEMVENNQSILSTIGKCIAPIFIPLGFGTWQASVSLLTGFIAKESVVSSMLVIYSVTSQSQLSTILQSTFNPISAFSFMTFSLLYIPCVSAIIVIKKEMNSVRWALVTAALSTGIAYFTSLIIFQLGSIFL